MANRGPDTLSLLSLTLMRPQQLVAEIEVGSHPRHFMQWGELVLVAAQEGDRIDVLRRYRGEAREGGGSQSPLLRSPASPRVPESRLFGSCLHDG